MRKHCIKWISLLLIIKLVTTINAEEQQAGEHRIQRRFMWQEMNNSLMGGIMGRMFNGARAMKSLFTDRLLPTTAGYGKNMLDFLPTETTRVKYIIRNPHTNKPMKIIKMRGSPKKVVKLRMGQLPKPGITETTTYNYDQRMRQLEKEQEMIVEGKLPPSSDEALMEKYFKKKPKPSSSKNDIVSGKIMEYQSWKPVYKPGEQPTSFVTIRPQALTHLHTDISSNDNELLPKPEKLVGHYEYVREDNDETDNGEPVENELAKQMGHRYEVTEHTGEESGETHSVASMESGFTPMQGYRSTHSTTTSNSPSSSRPSSRARGRHSNGTSPSTTTEPPNYPPAFLRKYREREASASKSNKKSQQKPNKEVITISSEELASTPPSYAMSSLRARLQEQQRRQKHQQKEQLEEEELEAALIDAMEGEKWPSEVQHSSYQLASPIGPSAVAFEQSFGGKATVKSEYKRPQRGSIRQRGSIKFNDKPNYDDLV